MNTVYGPHVQILYTQEAACYYTNKATARHRSNINWLIDKESTHGMRAAVESSRVEYKKTKQNNKKRNCAKHHTNYYWLVAVAMSLTATGAVKWLKTGCASEHSILKIIAKMWWQRLENLSMAYEVVLSVRRGTNTIYIDGQCSKNRNFTINRKYLNETNDEKKKRLRSTKWVSSNERKMCERRQKMYVCARYLMGAECVCVRAKSVVASSWLITQMLYKLQCSVYNCCWWSVHGIACWLCISTPHCYKKHLMTTTALATTKTKHTR